MRRRKSQHFIVAVDGFAGSGKSTIAQGVAQKLNLFYLDTGAMYRAITLKILKEGIDYKNKAELSALLKNTKLELRPKKKGREVYLDNQDVTKEVRRPEIDRIVSTISAIKLVREKMVKEQKALAKKRSLIGEGRDIASVVFPNADLKIFIDCDLQERAKRRLKELKRKKIKISLYKVLENLAMRDKIDSTRFTSPLLKTADGIYFNTTNLTIKEEINLIADLVNFYRTKL